MPDGREFDAGRAAAFGARMLDALNAGALCLMTSIGHRTGLFDALASPPAVSSAGLAARAGLDERYVREWLGAMTAAGVVEHDPEARTYRLPPEHAASLTRSAAPDNLAVYAQHIPGLAAVEDEIVACFRTGGGVPYERYARFHEVMAEDSGQSVLPVLETHILPLVPGLLDRLRAGIDVVDLGCGRGRAVNQLASRFPASRFVGFELDPDAVAFARAEAAGSGITNATFHARDLRGYAEEAAPSAFDLATTFDAVHDQPDPLSLVRGIRRTLRADGVYLAQDISGSGHHHGDRDHPLGTLLYTVSCMHCMSVSLAQGGAGLGAMWGRPQAEALFREAGFGTIAVHTLAHDPMNFYYVCRP